MKEKERASRNDRFASSQLVPNQIPAGSRRHHGGPVLATACLLVQQLQRASPRASALPVCCESRPHALLLVNEPELKQEFSALPLHRLEDFCFVIGINGQNLLDRQPEQHGAEGPLWSGAGRRRSKT